MRNNWGAKQLGKICQIRSGVGFPKRLQGRPLGKYPFAKVGDISKVVRGGKDEICDAPNYVEDRDLKLLRAKPYPPNTIVFAKIGEAIRQNFRAITTREMLFDNNVCGIIPDTRFIDPTFLLYFLRTVDFYPLASSTTVPSIKKSVFEAIEIPLPSIHEQRRIVVRIKELLERVAEIRHLRQKSLTDALNLEGAVFADFVLNNFNGDKEANIVPLSKLLERTQYGTSKKANTKDYGLPVLRMGNIQGGHLDTTNLKYIDLPEKEEKKYLLQEGNILFNRTNSLELVGKAATFTGLKGDWVFASYLIRLEVDRSKALPEYVTAVINSRIGKEFVYRTARRAIGMVNINAKQIQKLQIPLPSIPAQTKLVELMHEARNAAESIRSNLDITPILSLRESILHNAFGGKL